MAIRQEFNCGFEYLLQRIQLGWYRKSLKEDCTV